MTRLAALALAGLAAFLLAPTAAYAQPSSVAVGDAAEAWYSTGPLGTCSSPVGCPPIPTSNYPSNTLHVGVMAGQTTAITYVQPDLAELPSGQTATAGTMTLPLATVSGNGNNNDSVATIKACLATGAFKDGTQGSTAKPPSTDCTVNTAVKAGTTSFSLDLTPFLTAWNAGRPEYGIALIPDASTNGPTSDWHVAFNGRQLAGAPHVTSELNLTAPVSSPAATPSAPSSGSQPTASPGTPTSPTPPPAAPTVAGPGIIPSSAAASPPAIASPTVAGPSQPSSSGPAVSSTPSQVSSIPVVARSKGFQYPEVMLLPFAFAAALVFVVRVLTSDATPKRNPV